MITSREELIRNADQFAGKRVRVTVLSDDRSKSQALRAEIASWFTDGDALQITPLPHANERDFGDALVLKFPKQGLNL